MHIGIGLILAGLLSVACLPAQPPQPLGAEKLVPQVQAPPAYRAGTEGVVLDVIVRDKKGRPIKDLTGTDFRVIDDGVEQVLLGARLVEGAEALEKGAATPLEDLHKIRLVTLVFEPLGDATGAKAKSFSDDGASTDSATGDARKASEKARATTPLGDTERLNARKAALDLIKGGTAQNVLYSVVVITTSLNVLQPFTADRELLRTAIERATNGKYQSLPAESERIKAELKQIAGRAGGVRPGTAAGAADIDRRTAEVMLDMLQFGSSFSRDEAARISISSLLSLVRGQYSVPGRKTILYFSSGLYVPTNLDEPFRSVSSAANRGNVTFYSVDTRGVATTSRNQEARDALNAATSDIQKDITSTDGMVTKDQIMAADRAETAGRSNTQLPIRDLAESTGGFLLADANDFRPALKKVSEEVSSYYELTYNPGIDNYDGRFRKTRVESLRRDVVVQARNGYFALPLNARGPAVLPYELPLLKAIEASPAPTDVDFRAAALRVKPARDGARAVVVVEVPMSGVRFTEDVAARTFKMRISTLALLKDAKGEVVQKLSNDLPRSGPLAMLPQARAGNFIYKEQVQLAPGRYTLETAVLDHEAGKAGVKKSPFEVVAAPAGVAMSDLCLVRGYQPKAKDLDPNDPLQYQGGRITPTLGGQVFATPGAQLSVFFTVYPDSAIKTTPTAQVEFLVDGTSVTKLDLPLPAADAQGRIPYVMSAPAENMPPATYEIRVTVKQGDSTAEDRLKVTVAAR